ncbi:MAG: UDP-N-acetylmuramate dehydrogenase [Candidatus Omnitrophica bacterium]|nr:UDP-N-acetylmuramate dehydrogenase [Candidatus Omnitrophota bacterium]
MTTFRIGGTAQFFARPPDLEQLIKLVWVAQKKGIDVRILGAGSNILVEDKIIKGLVIQLSSPFFQTLQISDDKVIAYAGVYLNKLVHFCLRHSLTGAEFLSGIPGTIGGALVMNAGIRDGNITRQISDIVECIWVIDYNNGRIKLILAQEAGFAYRNSTLDKFIVIAAQLGLSKGRKQQIRNKIKKYILRRRDTQDWSYPNAGCIFKNPPDASAGQLIDSCGLKGAIYGGAQISFRHANFILNKEKAKCSDVLNLMRLAQRCVMKKYGISLEPEIKIWK